MLSFSVGDYVYLRPLRGYGQDKVAIVTWVGDTTVHYRFLHQPNPDPKVDDGVAPIGEVIDAALLWAYAANTGLGWFVNDHDRVIARDRHGPDRHRGDVSMRPVTAATRAEVQAFFDEMTRVLAEPQKESDMPQQESHGFSVGDRVYIRPTRENGQVLLAVLIWVGPRHVEYRFFHQPGVLHTAHINGLIPYGPRLGRDDTAAKAIRILTQFERIDAPVAGLWEVAPPAPPPPTPIRPNRSPRPVVSSPPAPVAPPVPPPPTKPSAGNREDIDLRFSLLELD